MAGYSGVDIAILVRVNDEDDLSSAIRHDEWMPAAIEPNQHCVPDAGEAVMRF